MGIEKQGRHRVVCLPGVSLGHRQVIDLLAEEVLLVENGGCLPIDTAQLGEVTVFGGGVGTGGSVLVTVEGRGCLVQVCVRAT